MTKYVYKNTHRLKEVRQFLRNEANGAEKILWQFLRGRQTGYKFRRQFSIGGVVVDFCSEQIKLAIEVDGWTHESEKTQAKDKKKEAFLVSRGYKVIRFTNEQMYGDIDPVWNEIKRACDERVEELGLTSRDSPIPPPHLPLM